MSTFRVELIRIKQEDILPHVGADRLEIVRVKGWQCVTQKGLYKDNSLAFYIPIDSVLPPELEAKVFPPDSKVKLSNSRVKTIRLRGAISQGMLLSMDSLIDWGYYKVATLSIGADASSLLGITKYEPPVKNTPQGTSLQVTNKQVNPHFRKYTDIENFKNYPTLFKPGDQVVMYEKIHGTNFRAGFVDFHPVTIWDKVKYYLKLAPSKQFVYGSHNVQLQHKFVYRGYYDTNLYARTVKQYDLQNILFKTVIYGEVYGPTVQKGYHYGLKNNETNLAVFDVLHEGQYLDHYNLVSFCSSIGLRLAPVIYVGPFIDAEHVKAMSEGPSVLAPGQPIREGVVIKPITEEKTFIGRKILKYKSDEFLLKVDDDTH